MNADGAATVPSVSPEPAGSRHVRARMAIDTEPKPRQIRPRRGGRVVEGAPLLREYSSLSRTNITLCYRYIFHRSEHRSAMLTVRDL
jgi:hypothetical protein